VRLRTAVSYTLRLGVTLRIALLPSESVPTFSMLELSAQVVSVIQQIQALTLSVPWKPSCMRQETTRFSRLVHEMSQ
jgi:hypothetical protein